MESTKREAHAGTWPSTADNAAAAKNILEHDPDVDGHFAYMIGGSGMPATGQAIEQVFGTKVVPIEYAELKEAGLTVDPAEARRWAPRRRSDSWVGLHADSHPLPVAPYAPLLPLSDFACPYCPFAAPLASR